ncbi:COG2426 family protein [Candidatus Omnitrophota bacterium]
MIAMIVEWLKGLPEEYLVMIVSALPVSELRGAIPLGLYLGMPAFKVFLLAVLGNLIPVIPLLFLLEPVSQRLRHFKLWARFFNWLFERTKRKAELVQRYEALGLALFVAIPLPITGAWTGIVAASLFKIRFKYAFPAICCGVLLAGVVVSLLCGLGIMSYKAVIH